jgi:hypothetical protein
MIANSDLCQVLPTIFLGQIGSGETAIRQRRNGSDLPTTLDVDPYIRRTFFFMA